MCRVCSLVDHAHAHLLSFSSVTHGDVLQWARTPGSVISTHGVALGKMSCSPSLGTDSLP